MNNKKLFLKYIFSVFFFIFSFFSITSKANAAVIPLTGWGWSSGIGWISFNCMDLGSCASVDYSVKVETSTGDMVYPSYAWSSNIGWIRFDGISDSNHKKIIINTSTGKVEGYARICAGTSTGDCVNILSRDDGWDGWLNMSDSLNFYPSPITKPPKIDDFNNWIGGITYNLTDGFLKGYSWGSTNIGWTDLSRVKIGNQGISASCTVPSVFVLAPGKTKMDIPMTGYILGGSGDFSLSPSTSFGLGVGSYNVKVTVTDKENPSQTATMQCPFEIKPGPAVPTFKADCGIPSIVTLPAGRNTVDVDVSAVNMNGVGPYTYNPSKLLAVTPGFHTYSDLSVTDTGTNKIANFSCSFTVLTGEPSPLLTSCPFESSVVLPEDGSSVTISPRNSPYAYGGTPSYSVSPNTLTFTTPGSYTRTVTVSDSSIPKQSMKVTCPFVVSKRSIVQEFNPVCPYDTLVVIPADKSSVSVRPKIDTNTYATGGTAPYSTDSTVITFDKVGNRTEEMRVSDSAGHTKKVQCDFTISKVGIDNTWPKVSLVANPNTVDSGGDTVLTWSPSNADICVATGDWSGRKDNTTGSHTEKQNNLTTNKTYNITCQNKVGSVISTAFVGVKEITGGSCPPGSTDPACNAITGGCPTCGGTETGNPELKMWLKPLTGTVDNKDTITIKVRKGKDVKFNWESVGNFIDCEGYVNGMGSGKTTSVDIFTKSSDNIYYLISKDKLEVGLNTLQISCRKQTGSNLRNYALAGSSNKTVLEINVTSSSIGEI